MNPFGGWDNFVRLFNGYKNGYGGYEWGSPTPEVPEKLKRIMLRRLKSEVLSELPPKTYKKIELDISELGAMFTKKLNAFVVDSAINAGLIEKKDSSLLTAAKISELMEEMDLTSLPSFSEFSKIRTLLAEARIPAMLEIVEEYEEAGTPLIVFSDHLSPINELAKRDGWKIITGDVGAETRRNIVHEFQEGKLKGLGITITSGGVGITLTRASNALFVDLNWTPSWNLQAEDRMVRIGQTSDNILIMRMSSNHPLDQHIQKLLEYKIDLAYKALDFKIKFKALPKQKTVELIEESDDELKARLDGADEEVNRMIFLGKLHGIAGREAAKVNDVPEPTLTDRRKETLRDALDYMISVCDGAETRDGVGFSKPDAGIARWIGHALNGSDDVAYRVLERILVRYRRQLGNKFEEIWRPE